MKSPSSEKSPSSKIDRQQSLWNRLMPFPILAPAAGVIAVFGVIQGMKDEKKEDRQYIPAEQPYTVMEGETIYDLAGICEDSDQRDVERWILKINDIPQPENSTQLEGTTITLPDPEHC